MPKNMVKYNNTPKGGDLVIIDHKIASWWIYAYSTILESVPKTDWPATVESVVDSLVTLRHPSNLKSVYLVNDLVDFPTDYGISIIKSKIHPANYTTKVDSKLFEKESSDEF